MILVLPNGNWEFSDELPTSKEILVVEETQEFMDAYKKANSCPECGNYYCECAEED